MTLRKQTLPQASRACSDVLLPTTLSHLTQPQFNQIPTAAQSRCETLKNAQA